LPANEESFVVGALFQLLSFNIKSKTSSMRHETWAWAYRRLFSQNTNEITANPEQQVSNWRRL